MKKLFLGFTSLFVFSILIISSQTSCKKENITQVTDTDTIYHCTPSIKGLWVGTYTVTGQPGLGSQYFSYIIMADGTLIVNTKGNNVQYLSRGTWTLTGNVFSATYTNFYSAAPPSQVGVVQNATATFDIGGTLLSGTWSNPSGSSNNSGTFTLTKVD